MSLKAELQYAMKVARGAGKIALAHYGKVERLTKTHQAASAEAVTEADRASQRYIVRELRKRYPNDGIIGEEDETGAGITFECPDLNGRIWVIDPIDGTNNFVGHFDYFAVSIGLLEKGKPVMGVVYDICHDRMYGGAKGEGSTLNGRPIRCPSTPLNEQALLIITANFLGKNGEVPPYACRWLGQVPWKIRCLGSAALDMMQVASGIAHGAVTLNGKLWDVVAPVAVLAEAGGKITTPEGKPIFPFDLRGYAGAKVPFLAAAPKAQKKLLEEIADRTPPKLLR